MPLTDEQRRRIEENKQKAIENNQGTGTEPSKCKNSLILKGEFAMPFLVGEENGASSCKFVCQNQCKNLCNS